MVLHVLPPPGAFTLLDPGAPRHPEYAGSRQGNETDTIPWAGLWKDSTPEGSLPLLPPYLSAGGLASVERSGSAVQFAVSDLNTYTCLLVKEIQ